MFLPFISHKFESCWVLSLFPFIRTYRHDRPGRGTNHKAKIKQGYSVEGSRFKIHTYSNEKKKKCLVNKTVSPGFSVHFLPSCLRWQPSTIHLYSVAASQSASWRRSKRISPSTSNQDGYDQSDVSQDEKRWNTHDTFYSIRRLTTEIQ